MMPTTLLVFEFLGTTELLVIALVALIIFGPRKLPEIGRKLGRGLAEFKRASEDFKRTWEYEVDTERTQNAHLGNAQGAVPDYEPDAVVARESLTDGGAAGGDDPGVEAVATDGYTAGQTIARAPSDFAAAHAASWDDSAPAGAAEADSTRDEDLTAGNAFDDGDGPAPAESPAGDEHPAGDPADAAHSGRLRARDS